MKNFYWPIYKNLEHELIALSNIVHIDDDQLSIYSVKIAELLVRCCVEIESISKDLFSNFASAYPKNENLYFDTDCINLLESFWHLGEKKIIISAQNLFFEKEENRIFSPLNKANKRGTSGSKWKQAYQAVKHNRIQNLKQANLKNLIHAMGALFVLNLYYRNDTFELSSNKDTNFLSSLSSIFEPCVHVWSGYDRQQGYYKKNNWNECVFYTHWDESYENKYQQWAEYYDENIFSKIIKHPKIQSFISKNFYQNGHLQQELVNDFFKNRKCFDVLDFKKDYIPLVNATIEEANQNTKFKIQDPAKYIASLNKEPI